MAWIEYHTALRDHWKIKRLSVLLEVEYITALGAISCLWLWAAEYAQDGDMSRFSDDEIRHATLCNNSKMTREALKNCELINSKNKINDWNKHGLKLLEARRKRQREYVRRLRRHDVDSTPTIPNQPNLTNLTNKDMSFSFDFVYNQYPSKTGKKAAERYFKSSVKTEQDFKDIQAALKNYIASERVKKGFIQNASTWFNNWRDWINYQDPLKGGVPESLQKYIRKDK